MPAARTTRTRAKTALSTPTNVVSFDRDRKKKGVRFKYQAFGRTWNVKAPNQVLATELLQSSDATSMIQFLGSFVDRDERVEFIAAAGAEEDFGLDELQLMMDQLTKVVYPDIPTKR